jgi:diguanylate cyclase (GGDEF)-like protein
MGIESGSHMHILSWFDNRTLITCDLLLAAIFAAVFFSTRRVYPNLRGVNCIAVSFLLGAPGTLLLASRGSISHFVSVIVASSCILGSTLFLYRGILRFLGSRRSISAPCAVSVAALAVLFYFSQVQDKAVPRILALSIAIGVVRGLIAVELFRKSPVCPSPKTMRLFAAFMAFFAALNVNCSVIATLNGAPANYLRSGAIGSVTLLFGMVAVCVIGLFLLILYSSDLIAHSKDESQKDALSGVLNRRGIEAQLAAELKNLNRGSQKLAIALIDIDHFKAINDVKGHAAGDAALCDMVAAVSSRLRGRDYLGRYGGDEFLLILPQTAAAMALLVAERMREAVDELSVTGRRQRLTLSIGLTEAVSDDDSVTLIARADKALYQAKSDGRNCLRLIRASDPGKSSAEAAKSTSVGDMLIPNIQSTLAQR